MAKEQTNKKGFLASLMEKLDKKLKAKASSGCCCCKSKDTGGSCSK